MFLTVSQLGATFREPDHLTGRDEDKVRRLRADDSAVTAWIDSLVKKSGLVIQTRICFAACC